jgi:hypothetical protein
MDRRGTIAARRAPGRFRCLPCQRYVTATEAGHCPACGFVPPCALDVPDGPARHSWLIPALVVVAVIVVLLLVAS